MFIDETRKSIQSILYERITSPLSGALFFSWFVWNWKIPYILLFSDKGLNIEGRLKLVQDFHINWLYNFWLPIGSAIFLIVIYPVATTAALNVWLRYKKWQRNIKNDIEKSRLLSEDESIQIKLDILNQDEKFNRLLKTKDDELNVYKIQIDKLKEIIKSNESLIKSYDIKPKLTLSLKQIKEQYSELKKMKIFNSFVDLSNNITKNNYLPDNLPASVITYFEIQNIIEQKSTTPGFYKFTTKGNKILKLFYDENIEYSKS